MARGQRNTFAELSPLEKNLISHRGKAFRALAQWLGGRAKCKRAERLSVP